MPGEPGPRDRAKETRAKADKVPDPRSKRVLLGLAGSYDRLAKRLGQRLRDTNKPK
jgi:hypothetical protein